MTTRVKVVDHRLVTTEGPQIKYEPTPRVGGHLEPRFVVIHFTVGQSAQAAASWLSRKSPGPSAHLVVARDGSGIQLAPLNRITFHCGPSEWGDLSGLDPYSIGIELDNAGPMTKKGNKWAFKFGGSFEDEDVIEAEHKHGGPYSAWHKYSERQLTTLIAVLRAIISNYDIQEILGHDDISPGRKWDPGPAFPMAMIRERAFAKATGGKFEAKDEPIASLQSEAAAKDEKDLGIKGTFDE